MSDLTRRVNRLLGRTLGVQVVPGATRAVRLNQAWFARLGYFHDLLTSVSGVRGDVVECGVAGGTSLAMLASLVFATNHSPSRRLWGFDAWAGLPDPSSADLAGEHSIAAAGMFGDTSPERVREELAAYGLGDQTVAEMITLVPGYFEQTLPGFQGEIALLHIDVDLYESYRTCLETLWGNVQPGGVVAFDEYEDTERWPGARPAVDEFLSAMPEGATRLQIDERTGKAWVTKLEA